MIVIDADDFCESNHKLDVLYQIHETTGALFNLFTIPGLCSLKFIEGIKKYNWIDMIPHGWFHPHPRECQNWTVEYCRHYLKHIEPLGLTKGFKAPGWQIPDGMYTALLEFGYWVADAPYNDWRRPAELPVFKCNADHHFHIGHMGGHNANEIELHIDRLLKIKGDFKFIKEVL
jgi:hypothetical protein